MVPSERSCATDVGYYSGKGCIVDEAKQREIDERLKRERNIWLATTRRSGAPHLVPIWYAWDGEKAYFVTPRNTQKILNIKSMSQVAMSLEDGSNVVIMEGEATEVDDGEEQARVAVLFKEKYDWDDWEAEDWVTMGVRPSKFLTWST